MEIQLIEAKKEVMNCKAMLDKAYDMYSETEEEQEPRRIPRTRELKRALELEKPKEVELANKITWNEQFSILIDGNWEHWLDKVNQHLGNLLDKANQQNEIQRKMVKHYANKEMNARAKLKGAKAKIEALTHQKEKEKLDILDEASLHAKNT